MPNETETFAQILALYETACRQAATDVHAGADLFFAFHTLLMDRILERLPSGP